MPNTTAGHTLTKEQIIRRKISRFTVASDLRSRNAAKALQELPPTGSVSSFIIRGMFSGLDYLPAILELAKQNAGEVYIATYGFSARNIGQLCDMIDTGKIKNLWLVCSMFTSKAKEDAEKYAAAVNELTSRGQHITPARNHSKLIAIKLEDGRTYCVDGSINMRSAKSIEQAHVWQDDQLFNLYKNYIRTICEGEQPA